MDGSGFGLAVVIMRRFRFSRGFYLTAAAVLVFGAAAVAVLVWLQGPSADMLYIPGRERVTSEIELLQEYIRIDTSNPPGRETDAAALLARELRAAGIEPDVFESAPGRANVHARLRGRREGEGLLLLHHIDVVPADPARWTHPPFAAEIHQNMIWGRGALDMKSIGIAHLAAFLDLARSGRPLERDVVFLAVADEEAGGTLGMGWIVENRPELLEGIRFAINEGGVTETVADEIVYFGIEVGSKLSVVVKARAERRETLEDLRISLEPWFTVDTPERLLPGVREYLQAVAPHRQVRPEYFRDPAATIARGRFWDIPEKIRSLMGRHVQAGAVEDSPEGGVEMDVVIHFLPDESPAESVRWFRDLASGLPVEAELVLTMDPAPLSSTATPFWDAIVAAIRQRYGEMTVGPMVIPSGTTDSRFLRARGIDAYGFWPFPVDVYQSRGIHGPDERLRLDWFMEGVDLTRELARGWARAEGVTNRVSAR